MPWYCLMSYVYGVTQWFEWWSRCTMHGLKMFAPVTLLLLVFTARLKKESREIELAISRCAVIWIKIISLMTPPSNRILLEFMVLFSPFCHTERQAGFHKIRYILKTSFNLQRKVFCWWRHCFFSKKHYTGRRKKFSVTDILLEVDWSKWSNCGQIVWSNLTSGHLFWSKYANHLVKVIRTPGQYPGQSEAIRISGQIFGRNHSAIVFV
jgi:hypothetical protein